MEIQYISISRVGSWQPEIFYSTTFRDILCDSSYAISYSTYVRYVYVAFK